MYMYVEVLLHIAIGYRIYQRAFTFTFFHFITELRTCNNKTEALGFSGVNYVCASTMYM